MSCPTPDVLPRTWCPAPHLVSCPTPDVLPHTWCPAPHLVSCPTPDVPKSRSQTPGARTARLRAASSPPADGGFCATDQADGLTGMARYRPSWRSDSHGPLQTKLTVWHGPLQTKLMIWLAWPATDQADGLTGMARYRPSWWSDWHGPLHVKVCDTINISSDNRPVRMQW